MRIQGKSDTIAQSMAAMLVAIGGMANLQEYALIRSQHCLDLSDLVTYLPVVKVGWATFGHSIRRLPLDLTLEGCEHVLSHH
jgi:hypothetical protein